MSGKNIERMNIQELTAEFSREAQRISEACYTRGKYGGMSSKGMYKRTMRQSRVADLIVRKGFGIMPSDLRRLSDEFWEMVSDMAKKELGNYL